MAMKVQLRRVASLLVPLALIACQAQEESQIVAVSSSGVQFQVPSNSLMSQGSEFGVIQGLDQGNQVVVRFSDPDATNHPDIGPYHVGAFWVLPSESFSDSIDTLYLRSEVEPIATASEPWTEVNRVSVDGVDYFEIRNPTIPIYWYVSRIAPGQSLAQDLDKAVDDGLMFASCRMAVRDPGHACAVTRVRDDIAVEISGLTYPDFVRVDRIVNGAFAEIEGWR